MWRALPALILLPSRSLSLSIFLSLSSLFLPSLARRSSLGKILVVDTLEAEAVSGRGIPDFGQLVAPQGSVEEGVYVL
jgi:hypothetical protein